MPVCDDCQRGADLLAGRLAGEVETVADRFGYAPEHEAAVNHDRCQARTDAQREVLPFALSGCTCQHRTPATIADRLDWHYGPTTDDPDPGKMWHYGCGQEVLYLEDGYICGCGAQSDDDDS